MPSSNSWKWDSKVDFTDKREREEEEGERRNCPNLGNAYGEWKIGIRTETKKTDTQ